MFLGFQFFHVWSIDIYIIKYLQDGTQGSFFLILFWNIYYYFNYVYVLHMLWYVHMTVHMWRPEAWDSMKQVAQARMSKRQKELWPWDMNNEAEAQMCALGGQPPVVSPTQVTKSPSSPIHTDIRPTPSHPGAVNWTWIIWKSNTHSKNPNNLSSIKIYFNYVHVCVRLHVGMYT